MLISNSGVNATPSRRGLLIVAGAAGASLALPRLVRSQPVPPRLRLGVLASSAAVMKDAHWVAFFERLRELGLVDGENLSIEVRHAAQQVERFPALAAELAKLPCDVFFTGGTESALAALTAASRTTPIVVVAVDFDPVTTGDVASLARPGGRVTGVTALQSTMPAKRLELLRDMLPGVSRIAVLSNAQTVDQLRVTQGTARRMGLALDVVNFKLPPFDYDAGFAQAMRGRAEALFVLGSGLWVPARRQIIDMALNARLPSMFHHTGWAEAGGLMSYGFDFVSMWRRGAEMVAAALRGAKAGEMPMEQPKAFEFAVNLKTARALGVKVPQPVRLRADRVFE